MPTAIARLYGGVIAKPGYSVFLVPWAGIKTTLGANANAQDSLEVGGGDRRTDGVQNSGMTWDIWLDDGTYKIALIQLKDTNVGICSFTGLNGTQTIDGYAASTTRNGYTEVTGVVVTKGLKTLQAQMATKNGASSAYYGVFQSIAIHRTGA